jgi:signal transduction histidine kinase
MNLPLRARVYLWSMVVAAVGLLVFWLVAWQGTSVSSPHTLSLMALFTCLAVVAIHFPLTVAPRQKVNLSSAVYFGSLLLFGAPAAMVLVGVAQLVGGITLAARRHPVPGKRMRSARSVLFNAGQFMVATGLAGLAYYSFLPQVAPAPADRIENLWALPIAAAVMYLANSLSVAIMAGLHQRKNPLAVWREARRIDALQLASLYPVGIVLALTAERYPWAPAIIALPACIIYLSLKRSVELVEQTSAALEAQRQLADRSEELARREAEAAALRELDQLKDEFVSTISHELRTPLTVVHGYASRLHQRVDAMEPASIKRAAEHILVGSTQLTRLVQDLVDYGRLQRGEVALRPEDFDLVPVLQEWLLAFRHQVGGERLRATLPTELLIRADRARLLQIVSNLVENALKYAPTGPIELRAGGSVAHQDAYGSLTPVVRVEVEDQGPGISPDEQPRLWEKFIRGRGVAGLNIARGSGIGLAVVKTLVEAQGGRVGLESTLGRGSRFWFELPAAGSVATAHTEVKPAPSLARPEAEPPVDVVAPGAEPVPHRPAVGVTGGRVVVA